MKVTFFSVLLAATLLFTTQSSYAETFRWIDDSGKIRIGIKPSAQPENTKKENKESDAEIKKSPSAIARPVVPKTITEHTAPAKIINPPKADTVRPAPAPVVTTPKAVAPIKAPVSVQPPKPAQKNSVKKPVVKKSVTEKKPEKVTSVKKKTTEQRSTNERNEEMCGVFTGYVNDYKEKVRDCSENLCDIYKRALARYKKKQRSYCK